MGRSPDQRGEAVGRYGAAGRQDKSRISRLGQGRFHLVSNRPGGEIGKFHVIDSGHEGESGALSGFRDGWASVQVGPGKDLYGVAEQLFEVEFFPVGVKHMALSFSG